MKRLCLLLVVLGAFAFTAMAQDASQTSSSSGQTTAKTSKSKSGDHSGMAMDHDQASMGKSSKGSTLTGCLSSSPNSDGMYTLSNAKNKKGVEVGPTDKVKEHAGHEVALTGKWGTAAEAGEANAASSKEKREHHFEVDSVKHIAATCSEAPGGGTTGSKSGKKSKGTGDTASAPKSK